MFETIAVREDGPVWCCDIAAPPMNLLGPELVRDVVSLIQRAEADDAVQVLVFRSADPDDFIAHVAARGSAVFSQFELAFGTVPGGGAVQHLTRLLGRARA